MATTIEVRQMVIIAARKHMMKIFEKSDVEPPTVPNIVGYACNEPNHCSPYLQMCVAKRIFPFTSSSTSVNRLTLSTANHFFALGTDDLDGV